MIRVERVVVGLTLTLSFVPGQGLCAEYIISSGDGTSLCKLIVRLVFPFRIPHMECSSGEVNCASITRQQF